MKTKFGLLALVTILATVSMPWSLNWTAPFFMPQASAQTQGAEKAEADRLLNQGLEQLNTSQFETAIQSFQQALIIYGKIKDRGNEGWALGNLGAAYLGLGDYDKAIKYSQQHLAIARSLKEPQGEGAALGNLGAAYYFVADYGKAIEYFQQHLAIARSLKDRQGEGKALGNLGLAYHSLSNEAKAIKYFQQHLAIARSIKDRQGEANALGNLGITYQVLGNHAKAINYQQQSLAILREIKDRLNEATALANLGRAYVSLGDNAKAIEYYQQSLAIARSIKARRNEGAALVLLGEVYHFLGDHAKAIEYFQQSLAIVRSIKDPQVEKETLLLLGQAYGSLGDKAQAIEYFQQSLAIAREVKDRQGEGQALGNLGGTYKLIDPEHAIEYLQQRLAIAREIKDRQGEGKALGNLGGTYSSLGNYGKAIEYLKQSLAIAQETKDRRDEVSNLGDLGLVYLYLGKYTNSIEFSQQSLAIARKLKDREGEGIALNNLGIALYKSGNLAAAEKTLINGIKVYESLRASLGSNDSYKISIFEEQASIYSQLQQVFIDQSKDKAALEIAERGRARAFVELLALRLSSPSATQSLITPLTVQLLQQIATVQNATLVEYSIITDDFKIQSREKPLESELFIWVIKPTGEAAFRRVDLKPLWQQEISSLIEPAPNSSSVVPVTPNSPAVETPTPESGKEIAILWRNPVAISLLLLTAGSIISIGVWGGRFLLTKKAVQNSPLKQRLLVPSLLLVLAVGSSSGFFFWMTRSQAIANNRNFRNDSLLAQLVDGTRESLRTKRRGLGIVPLDQKASQGDRLQQLHQILIQPIADLLPTDPNARVIFIPQSFLFLVPFPALKDASGKYLIEKHTILTAPSIQTLDLTRKQKQRIESLGVGSREALVVGNPTMPKVPPQIGEPPQQLPSLPGAQQEALAIAKLLKTTALTDNQATKQAVLQKMAGAQIVHLATHGLLDERRGLGSAIALAPNPNYQGTPGEVNGLLTAEEILNLKLNAELVVLSACDTGRGRITGDGVVGLSRSLISAGVPSVLVSLWSVPDAPTAFLMTEFYRNLQKNPDKAQALRQAMLTTMKQHPNPIDWAAFTLIGEAE